MRSVKTTGGGQWGARCMIMAACALWLAAPKMEAVIFFATADEDYHTTAPSGKFARSGWSLQGYWNGFLGIPIGPHHFITAGHIGGTVGMTFRLHGVEYETVATFDHTESDLRIWEICGTFPEFASLYEGAEETGKRLVVFGRGGGRGDPVEAGGLGGELKGWKWGDETRRLRWGVNVVSGIFQSGNDDLGELLRIEFNADGHEDEAHLSLGDSGGGVFVDDHGTWKLAGINYSVDGPYNTQATGEGFRAAIFDEGGLYKQNASGEWQQVFDLPTPQPGSFYATRISSNLDWIRDILARETGEGALTVLSASQVEGPYLVEESAEVNATTQTITIPLAATGRSFFRLRSCREVVITEMTREGEGIVLTYE